jgi:hypothetical protein
MAIADSLFVTMAFRVIFPSTISATATQQIIGVCDSTNGYYLGICLAGPGGQLRGSGGPITNGGIQIVAGDDLGGAGGGYGNSNSNGAAFFYHEFPTMPGSGTIYDVFVAMDMNHDGWRAGGTDYKICYVFINGVNMTTGMALNQNTPTPFLVPRYTSYFENYWTNKWPIPFSGKSMGIPYNSFVPARTPFAGGYDPSKAPIAVLSDFQMWVNTFIDPTVSGSSGVAAINPQPPFDGLAVDWALMQMLIDAMVAGSVDPLMMMTVYNIETQYGTVFGKPNDSHQGVFQFTQSEINAAGAVGSNFNNDANAAAFVFYNTVPGPDSWITPAINQFGSDPTGINRYTVYNQGSPVARAIWNASAGTTLGQLAASKGVPVTNLTGQSWANGGNDNRWAGIDPLFKTALTGSDLVSTWVSRLNAVWANASADGAARLGPPSSNIGAFVNPDGSPVSPSVPAALFGQQSILFSGNAAAFSTNLGTDGAFSVLQGPLVDFIPPA